MAGYSGVETNTVGLYRALNGSLEGHEDLLEEQIVGQMGARKLLKMDCLISDAHHSR